MNLPANSFIESSYIYFDNRIHLLNKSNVKKFYLLAFLLCAVLHSFAQWNSNTFDNEKAALASSSDIVSAATNDGRTYVVYYTPVNGRYYLIAQLLGADGSRLLGDSGVLISKRTSGTATFVFTVYVDTANNLFVGYQYQKAGAYHVLVSKVTAKGKLPWGRLGVDLGEGLSPSVISMPNGETVAAWDNNGVINYQKIGYAGDIVWPASKTITNSNGVTRPQLVLMPGSAFGFVYQQKTGFFSSNLYEQRFNNDGSPVWANPVKLSSYVTSTFHSYSVINQDDVTYVGYYANPANQNNFVGLVQKVNGDGSLPWGVSGSIISNNANNYQFDVSVAYSATTSRVWAVTSISDINQVNFGIAVQKFDVASGKQLLGSNGKTVFKISSNYQRQAGNLALCENGPLFMFYDVTNKLYATGLDTSGNFRWTGNTLELGSTTNIKSRYNFTGVYQNQAVAVWQEDKGDGDLAYAQNIMCDGTTGFTSAPKAVYSDALRAKQNNATSVRIKNIFPNPAHDLLNVNIESNIADKVSILITDASGKTVKLLSINITNGSNNIQINIAALSTGNYFIKFIGKNFYQNATQHFVKY